MNQSKEDDLLGAYVTVHTKAAVAPFYHGKLTHVHSEGIILDPAFNPDRLTASYGKDVPKEHYGKDNTVRQVAEKIGTRIPISLDDILSVYRMREG